MCWITHKEELAIPKIAEDNIVCNKLVRMPSDFNIIISDIYQFGYKLNIVYSICGDLRVDKILENDKFRYCILKGFHSYSDKVTFKSSIDYWDCINVYFMGQPILKNFVNETWGCTTMIGAIASCIIPKGSTYFLNERGEYVSNNIKILSAFRINKL